MDGDSMGMENINFSSEFLAAVKSSAWEVMVSRVCSMLLLEADDSTRVIVKSPAADETDCFKTTLIFD